MIIVLSLHPLSGRVAGRERGKQTETRVLKKKFQKSFGKILQNKKVVLSLPTLSPEILGIFRS